MKKYLLFDLDGTLTDPKEGITTCVQYALKSFGIEEPDLDKLEPFIGPPLIESFMKYYGMTEQQAKEAVEKYRERFQDTGIFENKIYDGIPEMLRTLQSKGMFLAVASSKPTVFVKRILEHFRIDRYFKVVVGSELDGTRTDKAEVVTEALKQLFGDKPVAYDQVYMIGDRSFDVEGAKKLRIESVGVTYGYGGMEELREARADYIVRSVEELRDFLLRGADEVKKKPGSFQGIWQLLFPFLMFILIRQLAAQILSLFMIYVGGNLTGALADFLVIRDESGVLTGFTGNASTIMSALSFVAAAAFIWRIARVYLKKTAEDMKLTHLTPEPPARYVYLFITTIGAVLGLNLLLELTGITNKSEAYRAVVEDQYSAALWLGLLCYGILTPLAEEILFRGIIFNRMRRYMNIRMAVLLSALFFGLYHMNMVQGVYAFVMGCLMAYAYEYFGTFKAPVAVHMMSNLIAYSLTGTSVMNSFINNWAVCIILLAVAGVGIYLLNREKKIF